MLNVEWSAPAGCGTKSDDVPSGGDDKEEGGGKKERNVGSGIGWFFLVYVPFQSHSVVFGVDKWVVCY